LNRTGCCIRQQSGEVTGSSDVFTVLTATVRDKCFFFSVGSLEVEMQVCCFVMEATVVTARICLETLGFLS